MEFSQRPWRRTSLSVAKSISVPTLLFSRYLQLKVQYPLLSLSRIASVGIARILDEIENDCNQVQRYTDGRQL
jgi:hypothetical protein